MRTHKQFRSEGTLFKITSIAVIISTSILNLSCSPKYGIERFSKPVERPEVEIKKKGCALIRSIYCDIYVEKVNAKNWEKLLKNSIFIHQSTGKLKYRVPKLYFFQIIIKNTWNKSIRIDDIKLKYGRITEKPLDADKISSINKSPMYLIFNFNNILSPRRILSDKYSIDEIDYAKDTIDLKLNFIPPSDTVSQIIAFNWIPVEYRKYKLIFSIYFSGNKKIIDFDFNRLEYRTKGTHFQKPKNNLEDSVNED